MQKHKKIHINQGDEVKIISGFDKGKIGHVVRVLKKTSQVIVQGINIKTKHKKSKQEGEVGQIVKIESPIHSSNVMLYDKETNTTSRYKTITDIEGKKTRTLIKLLKR